MISAYTSLNFSSFRWGDDLFLSVSLKIVELDFHCSYGRAQLYGGEFFFDFFPVGVREIVGKSLV